MPTVPELPWPVFLIGFMGTGKSTVGRALAGHLGVPFVDLDRQIEEDAGKSVAEIFAEDGEAQFRSLETAALARVAAGDPCVVATGGGAPTHDHNLETMRRSGLVIALEASLDELGRRVDQGEGRPLWSDPAEVEALMARRAPIYRRAHAVLQTDGRGISEVGRAAVEVAVRAAGIDADLLGGATFVCLERGPYPVLVTRGALSRLGAASAGSFGGTDIAIVSDDNVAAHYMDPAVASAQAAGLSVVARPVIRAGEASKSMTEFERVCSELVTGGLDRRSGVLALGGGVVGDLAGFVAASLYRGIEVVQVPTSLLAMVDSAIGGKTGINLSSGKNLVGAFWQPRLVLADPDVLVTLPARERRAAFGELLKYGLLDGEELLAEVEALAPDIAGETLELSGGVGDRLERVIRRCAGYKAWVVGRDEREQTGERALLNLGHTLGHAIEAAEGYGTLVHGEAVALGLLAACRVSATLGLANPALEERIHAAMEAAGLDTDLSRYLRDDVLERIKVDKKRTGTSIAFITVAKPGQCARTPVDAAELARTLRP